MYRDLFFFFCGMAFKKWMSSLMLLFILYWNSCRRIFISLLSLLVGHDGSTTIGLNLRSMGF